jgi:hypothetical protein
MRVRRAVVIKDSVNVKGNLSAHTRSWASMPRRQVGHLRGRVSEGMVSDGNDMHHKTEIVLISLQNAFTPRPQ